MFLRCVCIISLTASLCMYIGAQLVVDEIKCSFVNKEHKERVVKRTISSAVWIYQKIWNVKSCRSRDSIRNINRGSVFGNVSRASQYLARAIVVFSLSESFTTRKMILSGGKWIDHPRSYSFPLENRSVDRHVENASWLENTAHSRECCTIAPDNQAFL